MSQLDQNMRNTKRSPKNNRKQNLERWYIVEKMNLDGNGRVINCDKSV